MDHRPDRNSRPKEPLITDSINENIAYWIQQKNELTQVPQENVFDVAEGLDANKETESK